MPTPILMPALSPTMEEGTLLKWLVAAGDTVRAGDPVAEIETDKAVMEMEAVDEGTVTRLLVAEGTEGVKVNTPIAELDTGEGDGEERTEAPRTAPEALPQASPEARPQAPPETPPQTPPRAPMQRPDTGARIPASPLARRIARERDIELAALTGSGPGGRIVRADVERAAPGATPARAPTAPARRIAAVEGAAHVLTLRLTIPTEGLALSLKKANAALPEGPRLEALHFALKAAGLALRDCPDCNAILDGGQLAALATADIALDLPDGPAVLRDVAPMTLTGIAAAMVEAKPGAAALHLADFGLPGIDGANAPPAPPAIACLAVGHLRPGAGLALSLSLDRRAIDAAAGARLLGAIGRYLKNPLRMLL